MGYTLLTNDDGVDSPALLPFARALAKQGSLRVVVPDRERSWIGKAVSRFAPVRTRTIEREGVEIVTADGYPADCGNLGVHSLFGALPACVISGINVGLNVGTGFFYSSGTVGAAIEGSIAGLPTFAFSTGVAGSDRDWKRTASDGARARDWQLAAELAAELVREVRADGFPAGVDLLNVNFALGTPVDAPREVTRLAPPGYAALFREGEPGEFRFELTARPGAEADLETPGTDVAAVANGRVSITPIKLDTRSVLDDATCRRLERRP